MPWRNADGLNIRLGTEEGLSGILGENSTLGPQREIEIARKKAEEDARKAALAAANKPVENKSNPVTPATNISSAPVRKVNLLENTPEVTKVSVGFENNRGNLPWPVEKGTITSGFGRNKIEGTSIIEDNIGITIQTVAGTSVKSVFEGVVTTIS